MHLLLLKLLTPLDVTVAVMPPPRRIVPIVTRASLMVVHRILMEVETIMDRKLLELQVTFGHEMVMGELLVVLLAVLELV